MLWTNFLVATALLIGLVLAGEDIKEKVDRPDEIADKIAPDTESEHQEGQDLEEKNFGQQNSQQNGPVGIQIGHINLPPIQGQVLPAPLPYGHKLNSNHQQQQQQQGGFHQRPQVPQPVYSANQQGGGPGPQFHVSALPFEQAFQLPNFNNPQFQDGVFHGGSQESQFNAQLQHAAAGIQSDQQFNLHHKPGGPVQDGGGIQDANLFQNHPRPTIQGTHEAVKLPQRYPQQGGGHQAQGSVPSLAIQDVNAGQIGGGHDPQNDQFPGFTNLPGNDQWPLPQPEMPKIVQLDVKCEKNLMKVALEFDKPFNGVIFSKGHYSYGSCVHLPAGSGRNSVYFDVSINSCGTTGNTQNGIYGHNSNGASGSGSFFENTVIIQYDPQVQEVWDQARKLRCTWHDQYEKAVTFRPFPVDMLDVVRADFAGDNVGCWMQIQIGKGPWASEVSGIVKIGQTMTMVLAIKDDENKFDMLVRNCIAHDGHRAPIELVDSQGCVVRPKLMSRFTKIKNFGSSASVLSYAHFQAFKFPDSMEVHFQCTIQICRYQCPEQCGSAQQISSRNDVSSSPIGYVSAGRPREERDVSAVGGSDASVQEMTEIGLNRVIRVVSAGDLAFNLPSNDTTPSPVFYQQPLTEEPGIICMSTPGFAASLVVLLAILVISCIISAFMCLRYRSVQEGTFIGFPYELSMIKKTKH